MPGQPQRRDELAGDRRPARVVERRVLWRRAQRTMPDRPGHPRAKPGAEAHVGQPAPAARVAKQDVRARHDMWVDVVAALARPEQVLGQRGEYPVRARR